MGILVPNTPLLVQLCCKCFAGGFWSVWGTVSHPLLAFPAMHSVYKIPSTTVFAQCMDSITAGWHSSGSKQKAHFFLDPIWIPFLQNNPRNVSLQPSQALLPFSVYMCCPLSSTVVPAWQTALASPSLPGGECWKCFLQNCALKMEQKWQQNHFIYRYIYIYFFFC